MTFPFRCHIARLIVSDVSASAVVNEVNMLAAFAARGADIQVRGDAAAWFELSVMLLVRAMRAYSSDSSDASDSACSSVRDVAQMAVSVLVFESVFEDADVLAVCLQHRLLTVWLDVWLDVWRVCAAHVLRTAAAAAANLDQHDSGSEEVAIVQSSLVHTTTYLRRCVARSRDCLSLFVANASVRSGDVWRTCERLLRSAFVPAEVQCAVASLFGELMACDDAALIDFVRQTDADDRLLAQLTDACAALVRAQLVARVWCRPLANAASRVLLSAARVRLWRPFVYAVESDVLAQLLELESTRLVDAVCSEACDERPVVLNTLATMAALPISREGVVLRVCFMCDRSPVRARAIDNLRRLPNVLRQTLLGSSDGGVLAPLDARSIDCLMHLAIEVLALLGDGQYRVVDGMMVTERSGLLLADSGDELLDVMSWLKDEGEEPDWRRLVELRGRTPEHWQGVVWTEFQRFVKWDLTVADEVNILQLVDRYGESWALIAANWTWPASQAPMSKRNVPKWPMSPVVCLLMHGRMINALQAGVDEQQLRSLIDVRATSAADVDWTRVCRRLCSMTSTADATPRSCMIKAIAMRLVSK
jgi:hypothetical protein